jgi:putative membrane-bound dehydrogenase-like protein
MNGFFCLCFLSLVATAGFLTVGDVSPAQGQDAAQAVSCPDGFTVTHFADDGLASDIYCMTIDSQGRVVVAGRDYIRILVDSDSDGIADKAIDFAPAPPDGVQGMAFDGPHLYCSGGGGIIRYSDVNGDDRADGRPQLLFKIKTGNEHDAHAIRKGPDGWWYLTAGNMAGVTNADINSATSPIRDVRAGVILRFDPTFSQRQVFAHGFRNAYDFDFDRRGNLINYDSDGERDVTLPWYRPTRVFHVTPGSDAGWVSLSWKRPNYYCDMPAVLAELGRGSPTGVVCYDHHQFPAEYRGSMFVLDWTFGRVTSLQMQYEEGKLRAKAKPFLSGQGAFGFAPTDIEVGADGALYVCVGGRGTRGSVYRVAANQPTEMPLATNRLFACLDAAQPLSAWSRNQWEPLARELGPDAFVQAATDVELSIDQRCRAVEITAQLFEDPSADQWQALVAIEDPTVLARVAWLLGLRFEFAKHNRFAGQLLAHPDVNVKQSLLNAWCGRNELDAELAAVLLKSLHNEDRDVRMAATRFLTSARVVLTRNVDQERAQKLYPSEWLARTLAVGKPDSIAVDAGIGCLGEARTPQERLDALRLIKLGLGDAGPRSGVAPVFEGYVSRFQLNPDKAISPKSKQLLASVFPTGDEWVDTELARIYSMMRSDAPELANRLLAKITADTDPVSDIHYLISVAGFAINPDADRRRQIAAALVNLQYKIESAKLNQDNNWNPRIGELVSSLNKADPNLVGAIVSQPGFGHPDHCLFIEGASPQIIGPAITRMIAYQEKQTAPRYTVKQMRILAQSNVTAHQELLRRQFADPASRDDLILTLAERPLEYDRNIFIAGLNSPQISVVGAALNALSRLPASTNQAEQVALVQTLQRLGGNKNDYLMREQVIRRLQANLRLNFGFQFGEQGYRPQTDVIERCVAEVKRRYPQAAEELQPAARLSNAELQKLLTTIPWQKGDVKNGEKIFETRACAKCHGKRDRLGPDLAGVTKRFSKEDLFHAILDPSATVSSQFQTKIYETDDGKSHIGMVIYESVDGVLLRTSDNDTIRLEGPQIVTQEYLSRSLMPDNLLQGLSSQEYADLYAYLVEQ